MKRSPLKRGDTTLQRKTPLKRTGMTNMSTGETDRTKSAYPRKSFTPASAAQRRKVHLQSCAVCASTPCDPAHLTPRSLRGCDDPDCVIALCRAHHTMFDAGAFDLLPYLSGQGFETELAHMQGHYSDPISVVQRLSGMRWVPEREAA